MGNYTTNLSLYNTDMTTDGNDYFDFDRDLNGNNNIIDAAIGKLSTLTTTEKTSLVGAINELDTSKADIDLSNLSGAGENHFLNKRQITNCILEAPNGVATYTTSGGASTITAQEGLTVLIPNGRNADGTMNNITATVSNPVASQLTNETAITATIQAIILYDNSNQGVVFSNYPDYIISNEEPSSLPYSIATWFSPVQNKFFRTMDTGTTWEEKQYVPIATATLTFNNSMYATITSLNTFETADLLKRTDKFEISTWPMPSLTYSNLTLGASGSLYTAPAAGWVWIEGTSTSQYGWVQAVSEVGNGQLARAANDAIQCYTPVRAGGTFRVWYNDINVDYFRFNYAQGEV